ncbi:MAG: hypothetical protein ABIR16_07785 [Dokdonella sp.]
MPTIPCCIAFLIATLALGGGEFARAHSGGSVTTINADQVPASLAVRKALAVPPKHTTDLKFRDLFRLPVGPKGIQASEQLQALDGRRVRMVGFMVRSNEPRHSSFILAPMPVEISDEDEAEADDIPFNSVLVTLPESLDSTIPNLAGLIRVTGVLRVASVEDTDSERMFSVLIQFDHKPARALAKLANQVRQHQLGAAASAP